MFSEASRYWANRHTTALISETLFYLPTEVVMPLLGVLEIAIGICFIYEPLKDKGLYLLVPHMIGTFTPFIFAPERMVSQGLSLEAHYILKNIVLVAGAWTVQKPGFREEVKNRIEGLHYS